MAKILESERAALVCILNIHEKLKWSEDGMPNATSHHITTEHSGSVSGSDGNRAEFFLCN